MKCLYVHSWQYIYIYIYDYNLISILKKKKKRKTEKKENSLTLTLTLILSLTLSISIFEQYRLEPLVTHITVTKIQRFSLLGNLSPPPHSSPRSIKSFLLHIYYTYIYRTPMLSSAERLHRFYSTAICSLLHRSETFKDREVCQQRQFFFFFASTGSWAGFERRRYHWNWQNGLHARSRASWKFSKCFSFRSIGTLFRSTIG